MANIDQAPLAVGDNSSNGKKAEIYDISSKTWTEVADYPYHDKYVFDISENEDKIF